MSALAFDFDVAPVPTQPRRRLYAVRGTVDAAPVPHTLATALDSAWEALSSGRQATCMVCGAAMRPAASGGECGGCGSSLA